MLLRRGKSSYSARRIAGAAVVTALGLLAAFTACYSEQVTSYGAPGSLDLRQFPDPPDAPPLQCEGSLPGPTKDGGCLVSWSTTIFPKIQATGPFKCGDGAGCHGTERAPVVVAGNPDLTYANFTTYKLGQRQYIATGAAAKEADASAILCNLKIDSVCGTTMPPGQGLACGQDIAELKAWLSCGAPNN